MIFPWRFLEKINFHFVNNIDEVFSIVFESNDFNEKNITLLYPQENPKVEHGALISK